MYETTDVLGADRIKNTVRAVSGQELYLVSMVLRGAFHGQQEAIRTDSDCASSP